MKLEEKRKYNNIENGRGGRGGRRGGGRGRGGRRDTGGHIRGTKVGTEENLKSTCLENNTKTNSLSLFPSLSLK